MTVFAKYNDVLAEETSLLVHLIGSLRIKEKQSAYGLVSRLFVEV